MSANSKSKHFRKHQKKIISVTYVKKNYFLIGGKISSVIFFAFPGLEFLLYYMQDAQLFRSQTRSIWGRSSKNVCTASKLDADWFAQLAAIMWNGRVELLCYNVWRRRIKTIDHIQFFTIIRSMENAHFYQMFMIIINNFDF